ncbi:MAG: DUF2459 domain-containing protein [Thiohalophilus sp.]
MNSVPGCLKPAVVGLCALALWLGACAAPPEGLFPPAEDEPVVPIWLVSHGWHAGIVIERDAIPHGLLPEQADFPGARYLEFGWGDRDYYMTPEPSVGILLKAGLWPTDSVFHVVGFSGPVRDYFPRNEIIRVDLGRAGFERLSRHLDARFARRGDAQLGRGLYGDSRFYLSRDTYHLFNTCNVWTARTLRAAGCPLTPAFNITVDSLLDNVAAACGTKQGRGTSNE